MRRLPRPLTVAARLSLAVVWMAGLIGPAPAAPVFAGTAASAPAGLGPTNDDFANAAVITLPPDYIDTQDLSDASSQANEPFACSAAGPSVWYALTPADTGMFVFETTGTNVTHTLAIYTGTGFGDLNALDCSAGSNDGSGIGLLELLSAGITYYVQLTHSDLIEGALLAQASATAVLTVLAPAQVTGTVWDDQDGDGVQDPAEPGLPGASVTVLDYFDSPQGIVTTDADGNYTFSGLPISETLKLVFVPPPPGGWYGSPQNVGSDAADSDADPNTGETITFTLASLATLDLDAGFGAPAEISGRAWRDLNSNNVQDSGEPGLADVFVCLNLPGFDCDNATGTAADGSYSFLVPAGDYSLTFAAVTGYVRATANAGGDSVDSDARVVDGIVPTFTVSLGDVVAFDAGYQTTGFGDRVWRDFNANGMQDPIEPGVQGVQVNLYDNAGFVSSVFTGVDGDYAFTDLAPGDYAAVFDLPLGNTFSPLDAGSDAIDSDADTSTGRTVTITLSAGELDLSIDAGMIKSFFVVDNLNEYGDTTAGDGACNDTTSVAAAPFGECSLRAAIEEANANPDFDVIQFDNTVFSVTQSIAQTSAYTITASLWVDGAGIEPVTLDANHATRQFLLKDNYGLDVRLSGLTLLDGAATLSDPWSTDGGAIYNSSAKLTLLAIVIDGAVAEDNGGGVYNDAEVFFDTTTISNSTAYFGGGIFNRGTLTSTALTLAGNTADDSGGGLFNAGLAFINFGNIISNHADYDGGGVLNLGALHIDNSFVQSNTAWYDGAGLANEASFKGLAQSAGPAACLVATNCVSYGPAITLTGQTYVNANVAGAPDDYPSYGGGIYNGNGTLLVDNSRIFDNTVYGDGGGVYNAGADLRDLTTASPGCGGCAAVATIQNASDLTNNQALSNTVVTETDPPFTSTFASRGGGLFNAGLVFVDASQLLNNTANLGGGFYNDFLYLFCSCAAVQGPGPLSNYAPALFITNGSSVVGNTAVLLGDDSNPADIFDAQTASGLGGGGYNSSQALVANSQIDQNTAALMGGGVFNGAIDFDVAAGDLAVEQAQAAFGQAGLPFLRVVSSTVTSNVADPLGVTYGSGGGVFNLIGDVEIDGGLIAGNTASLWGGGLANGCLFCFIGGQSASLAAPQGPGIYLLFILFSQLYVHNGANIAFNDAGSFPGDDGAGGGVFNSGFAVIADSAVTTNTTTRNGGGLLNAFFLTLDHTSVADNRSVSHGGGIFNLNFGLFAQSQASSAAFAPAGLGLSVFTDLAPGISVEAPLVIRNDSSISNNRANPEYDKAYALGGGLYTSSPALITDSTIDGNWASDSGGGLAVEYGLTAQASAASSPACQQGFGGLFDSLIDRVLVNDTTISHNEAGRVEVNADPIASGGGVFVSSDNCSILPFEANRSLLDGNRATAGGGGIYVYQSEAYLHNTNLLNNDGDSDANGDGNGGASYNNGGYLLIDPANVIGNSAQFGGGGFYASGTTLITQTTFATNTAVFNGGGLVISGTAEVVVGNSTLSANTSNGTGSAIYQQDDTTSLVLANVTIANNIFDPGAQAVAGLGSAGYFRAGTGTAVINNTLIFGNGGPAADCVFTNPGTNVGGVANMGDATCSFLPGWTTADPLLGPLQYNGGANGILTHALGSLSPAIDAANTGVCGAAPVFGVDERDNLRLLDLACDIGAYEFESLTAIELVAFTATAQGDQVQLAWQTAVELDTAGFNLYRAAAPGGPYVQINPLLIAAQGPQGGSYTAPDAPGVGTWYYKLEDMDTSGVGTLHGPVAVTVGSGANNTHQIFLPIIGNK